MIFLKTLTNENRLKAEIKELKELVQRSNNLMSKMPTNIQDRVEDIEKKIGRIERRLNDAPNAFDLARDFTWHELKNICVKVTSCFFFFFFFTFSFDFMFFFIDVSRFSACIEFVA